METGVAEVIAARARMMMDVNCMVAESQCLGFFF